MNPKPSLYDFDALAAEYDSWYETPEGRLYDVLEKHSLQRLLGKSTGGEEMLEVGAGTGWWSLFFSRSGFRVTGVDISGAMVEVAESKKIPNARFSAADAHELPFADHTFPVSAAITSIEFTRQPEKAIDEMIRCTKPGGRLILGVLNAESPFNRSRKQQAVGPYEAVRLFSSQEITDLLAVRGKTITAVSAFPLSVKLRGPAALLADDLQALIGLRSGAFLAASVEL